MKKTPKKKVVKTYAVLTKDGKLAGATVYTDECSQCGPVTSGFAIADSRSGAMSLCWESQGERVIPVTITYEI